MAVGLHQHERRAVEHGRESHGPGHVAAGAERRRRPQPAHQALCLAHRRGVDGSRFDGPQRGATRQGADSQLVKLVSGCGNELGLGPFAADEHDLRALSSQRVGDRQCRYDVSRRPAGSDHDPAVRHG